MRPKNVYAVYFYILGGGIDFAPVEMQIQHK